MEKRKHWLKTGRSPGWVKACFGRAGSAKTLSIFFCTHLARMASAYSRLEVMGVRAVATSAVRDASNRQEFLHKTSVALGTNVEIISGSEEARLIHLGVESRWPRPRSERSLLMLAEAAVS